MAYSHDDVAHNWAHQTGRKTRGFNMFYEGDIIYSYGYHFPIARLYTAPNGDKVVLFNNRSYSVSTSQHQSIVRRSIPEDREVIFVPDLYQVRDPERYARDWHTEYKNSLPEIALKYKRARTMKMAYLGRYQQIVNRLNRLNQLFKLRRKTVEMPDDLTAAHKEYEEARKREAKLQLRKDRKLVKAWLNGADVRPPHTRIPYVRVKDQTVETSWGIKVPLDQAIPVFRLAKLCAQFGHVFNPNKRHEVGGWAVDSIGSDGTLKAGCHVIPLKVQLEAAKLAGVV